MQMYYSSQYYREEDTRKLERAAVEKQFILASKEESDKRVEEMVCTISSLKVMQLLLNVEQM